MSKDSELQKIVMKWRYKVHRLEMGVVEGRISKSQWEKRPGYSDADEQDERINKGLARDIEAHTQKAVNNKLEALLELAQDIEVAVDEDTGMVAHVKAIPVEVIHNALKERTGKSDE